MPTVKVKIKTWANTDILSNKLALLSRIISLSIPLKNMPTKTQHQKCLSSSQPNLEVRALVEKPAIDKGQAERTDHFIHASHPQPPFVKLSSLIQWDP